MESGGVVIFGKGQVYPREQTHEALGGGRREALPTSGGKVVCACLTRRMNPRVRSVIEEPGALLALVAEGAPADASLALLLEEPPGETTAVAESPAATPPAGQGA